MVSVLILLLASTISHAAISSNHARERRVAFLVAHPFGGEDLTPLRYTANDLYRMQEVLQNLGGFAKEDIIVSLGQNVEQLRKNFTKVRKLLKQQQEKSNTSALFLFYYSGHAKDGALRLGNSQLPLVELKQLLEATGAKLQVALLDACRAGGITLLKGATRSQPITISVDHSAMQTGQVLISASSENEDAQEADDIQGSFFTHFITSGLRGAADSNNDALVTLSEAYAYAYSATVARTVASRGGIQHPTFRFNMRGAGDVVLTRQDTASHILLFPEQLFGSFVLFDNAHRTVTAELEKSVGEEVRLAVDDGDYILKKRELDHVLLKNIHIHGKGTTKVTLVGMQRLALADDYAKGAVITIEEIRQGRLGVRLIAMLGTQTFLSAPIRSEYLPNLGTVKLELALTNLLRRHLGLKIDAGIGSSGNRSLTINDRSLGKLNYNVEVTELTLGLALLYEYPINEWLTLNTSGRLGMILVNRKFIENFLPPQNFATLTPGLGVGMAFRFTEAISAGANVYGHYMYFESDETQSLAYLDAGLYLAVDLR
ncbi:MAG: caspase family protein [Deltaproteobacteria bacterium]|nr:caspase family protein [Deltaproteobacteria bacterium]